MLTINCRQRASFTKLWKCSFQRKTPFEAVNDWTTAVVAADQPSGIFLGRHDGGTRQQGKGRDSVKKEGQKYTGSDG